MLNKQITQSNLLALILFAIQTCYFLSFLFVFTPNYVILENRVMYDRLYKIEDHIQGTAFDGVIEMLLFAWLLVLFLKRRNLMIIVQIIYIAIIIILRLALIPIHELNIVLTPLLMLLWFFYDKSLFKSTFVGSLNFLYLSLIVIGTISIGYSIISISGILSIQDRPVNFTAIWFSMVSQLTPYLFIILFFLAGFQLSRKIIRHGLISQLKDEKCTLHLSDGINRQTLTIAIAIIVVISILITLIPHLPTVSPETRFVGYDSGYYIRWLKEIEKGGSINEILSIAFHQSNGDRFLSLILILGIQWITSINIEALIEYMPSILSPLLAIVTYKLTFEMSGNSRVSLLSSILTPFSVQVSMGIYSGYYSNWMAIIIAYTSMIYFIKYCKFNKPFNAIMLGIGLTALCFTHIYTWFFFVICFGFYIVLIPKYQSVKFNFSTKILVLITLAGSSIGFLLPWLILGNLTGLHNFMNLYNNDFQAFSQSFINLFNFVVLVSHGGTFSNVMIPILCIVFLYFLNRQYNYVYLYLIVILLTLSVLTVFLGGIEFKTRILYNIPFQIPSAIGLMLLYEWTRNKYLFTACCLLIIGYSLYTLTNYYLIPPEIMYPQDFSK
ncbi:hypothetical protein [Candidatus Nitrosocosmicus sp. SS]|uniref:hypothetical protein n=1 Tax=Candidatus Nitrosocosmicus agrestis TaxID=2563600 RepID=UPI00122E77B9|nr:hypothetical protein [Candidatus Nitrosocosmicus sp. SS]KAA2279345.1 hypothetical protein F1Z66_13590 [Candidatus Nitrosocosmicus sp. SS]KAF0867838.1 hypothetical protein E5N71_13130 [Candidatus Nitrosocosmicus sp. SS]